VGEESAATAERQAKMQIFLQQKTLHLEDYRRSVCETCKALEALEELVGALRLQSTDYKVRTTNDHHEIRIR
jgi:hypothetical protein